MGRRTPLFELHRSLGARMVDFGGWEMPLHYGSQLEEHHAVRRAAGMFDVSHMGIVDVTGAAAEASLRRLLANDVARLREPGQALYGCMLNEGGGILDDLIVYRLAPDVFRVVVNAATRERDLTWIRRHADGAAVTVRERDDLAMLSVQGPEARSLAAAVLRGEAGAAALQIPAFHARELGGLLIARTGYTGEDGFELMLPAAEAPQWWRELGAAGIAACGLGARDTLRLEAGLNLYGSDMDESTHPYETGLGWTVALEPADRDFVGRRALERIRAQGPGRRRVGLVLEDRGVLRRGQRVIAAGVGEGEVTSGTFSPTLQRSIALARIPAGAIERVTVDVRGRELAARVVRPPFVRHGKALVS